MSRNRILFVLFVLAALVMTGCGPETVRTVKVSGNVTLDGKPVDRGAIQFIEADGSRPTGGGVITNGTYTADVPPGKKKVLVFGLKVTGQEPLYLGDPNSPMRDKTEPMTPGGYNVAELTPLEAEIPSETKDLNFDLSSKFKK
ncbi:MAG: hypothetical protein LBQ54_15120 [Planctomycetaceae bacterium]|jgi:hypothetical protein|nr:hypothetical protein [Planctomycetaceae bacterium]